VLAGLIWNHAPHMELDGSKGVSLPQGRAKASDMFAYFFGRQFFATRGGARRGRKDLVDKECFELPQT